MFSISFSSAGVLQRGVAVCAFAAFGLSMLVAACSRRGSAEPLAQRVRSVWIRRVAFAALLLCVAVGSIQAIVLTSRALLMAIALSRGAPSWPATVLDFGSLGLLSCAALLASCLLAQATTSDRRLATCSLWCGFLCVTWGCLLTPEFMTVRPGAYERTASTLWVMVMWSVVLTIALNAARMSSCGTSGNDTSREAAPCRQTCPLAPGFAQSVIVLATGLLLLSAYHLAVPVRLPSISYSVGAALVTASTGLAGVSCFRLLRRTWSRGVADVALGLTSLALCAAATIAVPVEPGGLSRRYPVLFSAMIVGLALSMVLWTAAVAWLADIDDEAAQSPWWRLRPYAKRFAFLSGSLALLLGLCLAIWPRRPTVPAMDDSLGRVAAGLAANLFLLLMLLWCARRLRSIAFHVLAGLAVVSTAGFVVARMLPFTPGFG